jgi:hypothetical protein
MRKTVETSLCSINQEDENIMQKTMSVGLLSFKRMIDAIGSFINGLRGIMPVLLIMALFFACSHFVHGKEYFVGLRGDDGADCRRRLKTD